MGESIVEIVRQSLVYRCATDEGDFGIGDQEEELEYFAQFFKAAYELGKDEEEKRQILYEYMNLPGIKNIVQAIVTSESLQTWKDKANQVREQDRIDPFDVALKLRELYINKTEHKIGEERIKELADKVYKLIQSKREGKNLSEQIKIDGGITLEIIETCAAYVATAVVVARNLREDPKELVREICEDPQIGEILRRISTSEALKEYESSEHSTDKLSTSRPKDNRREKQVEPGNEEDNSGDKKEITKHKVLGDIHGYKEAYDKAMAEVNQNEFIVLLGDVIDRGKDGIKILQDLIARGANEEGSNIIFLMGNHEAMMLSAIKLLEANNVLPEEIEELIRYGKQLKRIYKITCDVLNDKDIDEAEKEKARKCIDEIKGNKIFQKYAQKYGSPDRDLSNVMLDIMRKWLDFRNDAEETLKAYMKLDAEDKRKIRDFLEKSYVVFNQVVEEQNILYVHSRPPRDIQIIRSLKGKNNVGIRYNELDQRSLEFALWEREEDTYTACKDEGFLTVCGHKVAAYKTVVNRQKGFIRIDEGCGSKYSTGLYCIEDGTIMHIGFDGNVVNNLGKIEIIDEQGKSKEIEGATIVGTEVIKVEKGVGDDSRISGKETQEIKQDTINPFDVALQLRELYIKKTDKETGNERVTELANKVYHFIQSKREGKNLSERIKIDGDITLEIIETCAAYIATAVVVAKHLKENPKELVREICEDPQIGEILRRISTSEALKEYESSACKSIITPEDIRTESAAHMISSDEISRAGSELTRGMQTANEQGKQQKSFRNELRVEKEPEEKNNGDKKGIAKHKSLGDIHGQKKAYDKAMEQVGSNESIVILGDVIDRGEDGIEILLDLIARGANEEGSNIIFLMGNHELMMLKNLRTIKKYGIEQTEEMVKFGRSAIKFFNQINKLENETEKQQKKKEYIESDYWKRNTEKYNIEEVMDFVHWIDNAGGIETINKFLELPEEQQDEITRFLEEAYIAYNQVVEGENKLYVHSRPFKNMDIIRKMKGKNGGVKLKDLDMKDVEFCLWNREEDTFTPCLKEGFFTICGHTISGKTTIVNRKKGFICLDEGCGTGINPNNPNATVGLYCIEDNTVLHIRADGEIEKNDAKIRVINEDGEVLEVKGIEIPPSPQGR